MDSHKAHHIVRFTHHIGKRHILVADVYKRQPGDSHFSPETDQSIYERELMRTEAALQEMDRAMETLLEQLTAETNMETTGRCV